MIEERVAGSHYAVSYDGDGFAVTNIQRINIAADSPNSIVVNDNTGKLTSISTLNVARGGTGAGSFVAGDILIGAGVSPIVSSGVNIGDVVTLTDAQAITNKTLTDPSNDLIARALFVGSGAGSVSTYAAAAPTVGQVLTATSASTATWQTPSGGGGTARTIISLASTPIYIDTFLVPKTQLYYPWVNASHTGFTNAKLSLYLVTDSSNVTLLVYNTTTAASLGSFSAIADGFYEFAFTLPVADSRLELRTLKNVNDIRRPYIYGVNMVLS
jgi:hypothetical protein